MKLSEHVNERVLYRERSQHEVFEGLVSEVSPSGDFVKITNSVVIHWVYDVDYEVIEVLPKKKKKK